MIGINGGFLVAPITGVQRFAFQLLLGLLEARPELQIRVYVPPLPDSKLPLIEQLRGAGAEVVVAPRWAASKQVFEQIGLPMMAFGDRVSCLIHLNNNVSLVRRKPQVCFVYDIATIRVPNTYRAAYRLKFRATLAGLRRRRPAVVTLSEFSRGELESVGVHVSAVVKGGIGSPMLVEAAAEESAATPAARSPYALVFGSADPRKRVEEVIAAWPPVFATLGLSLVVVQGVAPTHQAGNGALRAQQGVTRLGGRISDAEMAGLIRGAEVAIFGSRYEGGALAAQEVLALGTPVIASDIPTFRELLGPPVIFAGDLADLPECCAQVLAAPRTPAMTGEQIRSSWTAAGAEFAEVIVSVTD